MLPTHVNRGFWLPKSQIHVNGKAHVNGKYADESEIKKHNNQQQKCCPKNTLYIQNDIYSGNIHVYM